MAVRTVSVELKMKISDFELAAAKAAAISKALGDDFDHMGTSANKFSTAKPTKEMQNFSRVIDGAMKDGKTGFQSIQQAIDDTKTHITKLKDEFRTTGSSSIFGDLKSAQKDLRTLENVFKEIAPVAEKAGLNAGNGLLNGLESAVSGFQLGPLGGPIGLGILAAATPIIVSGLAAAISAGVGLGVIGLAAAIDRNDPAVVKAFTKLKDDAVAVFQHAADPLAAPLAGALASFDRLLQKEAPQIQALFSAAGQSIGPVTAGLEKLTSDLLPTLVTDAQSFATALADPRVQASLSAVESSFTGLMKALGDPRLVKEGFIALDVTLGTTLTMLQGIVAASQVFGDSIHYLREAGSAIGKFFGGGPDQQGPALVTRAQVFAAVAAGADKLGKSEQAMGEHAGTSNMATQALGFSVQSLGEHAGVADPKVDAVGKSMASMGEHAGTANQATQAVGFSVQSLGEHAGSSDPAVQAVGKSMQSMGEHAGTSNLATQALGFSVQSMGEHSGAAMGALTSLTATQQKNTGVTLGELQAFQSLDAQLNTTFDKYMAVDQAAISVKQAQADLESELKRSKKTWDLNTQAGRDNYSQLLTSIQTDKNAYDSRVALEGATKKNTSAYDKEVQALLATASKAGLSAAQVAKLRKQFEALPPSVTIPVNVHVRVTGAPGTAGILGGLGGRTISRWGGVYQPAADGLLSSAQVYTPVNPGRFMIAEPQTGGEAFIPKRGDYGRSMSILSAAAGWYGARVVDGNNGGGGGTTNVIVSSAPGMPREFLNLLRFTVQNNGGDVVQALKPR